MERSNLGTAEVVGIATAAAAAVGGLVVALSRAQADHQPSVVPQIDAAPIARAASVGVERGRDTARSAIESLSESYPDIRESAMHLISRLGDAARPAADRATTTMPSADEVRATGASILERLQETVQETVLPAAGEAIHQLRERVEEGRDRAQPPSGIFAATGATAQRAVDRSSHAAQKAVTTSTSAAQSAVVTSKNAAQETMAAAVWMTIAGALLYFVFLSEEQREKLRTTVAGAIEQIQLLIRDFQGYEDEF